MTVYVFALLAGFVAGWLREVMGTGSSISCCRR